MRSAMVTGIVAAVLVLGSPGTVASQQREAPGDRSRAQVQQPPGWLGLTFDYHQLASGARAVNAGVVTRVHPGSPAARAGLQAGDTIVRLNGSTDVEAAVRGLRLQAGDTVRVRIRRGGERQRDLALVAERRPAAVAISPRAGTRVAPRGSGSGIIVIDGDTIRVPVDSLLAQAEGLQRQIRVLIADSLAPRLRELEGEFLPMFREQLRTLDTAMVRAFPDGMVFEVGRRAVAGAEFSELEPGLAEYFQGAREGLLVLRVAPESPAARAGLRPGDVVIRANGQPTHRVADLRRTVAAAAREEVRLDVVRRGRETMLRLR